MKWIEVCSLRCSVLLCMFVMAEFSKSPKGGQHKVAAWRPSGSLGLPSTLTAYQEYSIVMQCFMLL
jgi:hypothetical protein